MGVNSLKHLVSAILFASLLLGCGGGDSSSGVDNSGGVGKTVSALYHANISYSGYNTCGAKIPGSGTVVIQIGADGRFKFDPVGLKWRGGSLGSVWFDGCCSGSTIDRQFRVKDSGYLYKIDARIENNGATISGTGYIEGNYGSCYEKFQGAFAGTRVQ